MSRTYGTGVMEGDRIQDVGSGDWTRTSDLGIMRPSLCRLSYAALRIHTLRNASPATASKRFRTRTTRCIRNRPIMGAGSYQDTGISSGPASHDVERWEPVAMGADFHRFPDRKSTRLNSSHGYIS